MSKLTATWMGTFESLRGYENIPKETLQAMIDYIVDGRKGGDFLNAVFANDLQGAFRYGDLRNLAALWAIVTFVYNRAPIECHGSRDAVKNWPGLKRLVPNLVVGVDPEKIIAEMISRLAEGIPQ